MPKLIANTNTDYYSIRLQNTLRRMTFDEVLIKRPRFHGADVGGCARRAVVYATSSSEKTEKQSLSTHLFFSMGTAAHKTLAEAIGKDGALLTTEYPIEETLLGPPRLEPMHGYVDLVMRIGGTVILGEIKTCNALPIAPKYWHTRQLQTYMLLTGVRMGLLIYLSRKVMDFNGLLVKVFSVSGDLHPVALEMARASVYANANRLPPKAKVLTGKAHCGFCAFTSYCWGRNEFSTPEATKKEAAVLETEVTALADILLKQGSVKFKELEAAVLTRPKEKSDE